MPPNVRPRTSQPRGVCKYYTTPRGCFAGSTCKFLHGALEQLDPQNTLLTPYDESKRCIFYSKGFCRRGDLCWFKHALDISGSSISPTEEDLQNEPCSICFETPIVYGLLSGCSHIFCITCIRQWRDQKGQTEHGNMKKCPMCREPSKFITPSSRFWKHGHPEKEKIITSYKDSMARVPCRYFRESLQRDNSRPLCPFGKDCFYQHLNHDGTPYVFRNGPEVCMRHYYISMRPPTHPFDDFVDEYLPMHTSGLRPRDGANILLVQLTVDDGMIYNPGTPTNQTGEDRTRATTLRENPHIRRQLRLLRDAMDSLESAVSASNNSVTRTLDMVRMLVQGDTSANLDSDSATESVPERRSDEENQTESRHSPQLSDVSIPLSPRSIADVLELHGEDYYELPALQSLSTSSSSDTYLSDSDSDSDDVSRLGRYLRGVANASPEPTANHTEVSNSEDEEGRMMQEIAERGPEVVGEVTIPTNQIDEPQIPAMEYEFSTSEDEADHGTVTNPPFLTDGRGRVVWSSGREAGERENSELSSLGVAANAGELQAKHNGLSSS